MKQRPKLTLRQTLLAAFCLLAITICILLLRSICSDQNTFDRLTGRIFTEQLTASTIDLHYTLAHPHKHGITEYTPTLPVYDPDRDREELLATENLLTELRGIDGDRLTPPDADLLTALEKAYSLRLESAPCRYFGEPLSVAGGMHVQLPILLSEYTFRSIRDVEDYLALIEQTDRYFASLLSYEQHKKEAGLFMSAASLDKVISQCDSILTRKELTAGSHFLQICFNERLENLALKLNSEMPDTLTPTQQAEYIRRHNESLLNIMLPAYDALSDGLFLLRDDSAPLRGLAAFEDGQTYYEYLLKSTVGSYRAPADIKNMYISQLLKDYASLCALIEANPDMAVALRRGTYHELPFENTDDMLKDLQNRISADFPSYLFAGTGAPTVTLKKVHPCLSPYSAPAFYLTVPLDDSDSNVIYLNNTDTFTDLTLYTTLAHEGFPGHLYQTVYHNRHLVQNDLNPAKQLLWYGGYLEGWALYTEFFAYDYAADILRSDHRFSDAACVEMEKHNRSMQLCLYSLLDYVIHYENALPQDLRPYLEPFGITEAADILTVYQSIVEDPCNYPKYYLGYLEICCLQQLASQKWGTAYTDYRFHTFLLENGPADFEFLQQKLTGNRPQHR